MILSNKELGTLLTKKSGFVDEGRAITKQIEELETARRKVGLQIQKLKDKIVPLVAKLTEGKLAEFEEISTVDLKGDEIEIKTFNVVEDFKRDYLEAKKNQPK
jgi:hypothetical protein